MKKLVTMSAVIALSAALGGCTGNDRQGAQSTNRNNASPMGYYSNENDQSGNARLLDENDGPITEMMDHTLGGEGKRAQEQQRRMLQVRDENGNPPNPTVPLAKSDKNFYEKDNQFSTGDTNYHGHLNNHLRKGGSNAANIERAAASVRNVRDVHSVAYGTSVVITVDLKDESKAKDTKKRIQKAVRPYIGKKSCTIITDEGTFTRNRNRHNDIREGGAR
ncbi:YhcN/YlaJ family sporulation lipoprotein [Neobacillus terrae]|uniref:YhcN/YlaJ family sporulation lipoprotein n=1 Tax=Neobacillus terrae TaxID=3034837 RepID=UPI001FB13CDB|nr:YhcN/YlaJ family sporulation lipoprotein [Neobacillus terrae]